MFIYDAEMLEDDGSDSLAAAQERKANREDPPAEVPTDHCVICHRDYPEAKTYRTGAGTICAHCSHEMNDQGQP